MLWLSLLPRGARLALLGFVAAVALGGAGWAYLAQRDAHTTQLERIRAAGEAASDYQDARRRGDAADTGADLTDDARRERLRQFSTGR